MDFVVVNQWAERIEQGENGDLLARLTRQCTPYFLMLRKKLGFYRIPEAEVQGDLASDAITKAFVDKERRGLPFGICMHNAFRDCCRQRMKSIREHDNDGILDKIIHPRYRPPDLEAQLSETVELVNGILKDHEPFSKKVVFQRMKGSTYPEMGEIFKTTTNECKRVFWHDFNDIRTKIRHLD